ncbi:MAG UNVERIFIED_CONTAM: hypothetical protein LVT10_24545 [Anaerolineae bacterium]
MIGIQFFGFYQMLQCELQDGTRLFARTWAQTNVQVGTPIRLDARGKSQPVSHHPRNVDSDSNA